jgi:hypothetical protein
VLASGPDTTTTGVASAFWLVIALADITAKEKREKVANFIVGWP